MTIESHLLLLLQLVTKRVAFRFQDQNPGLSVVPFGPKALDLLLGFRQLPCQRFEIELNVGIPGNLICQPSISITFIAVSAVHDSLNFVLCILSNAIIISQMQSKA